MATQKFDAMFSDIRELCIACAKAITVISNRHNVDPRTVSELFIEVYNTIHKKLEESEHNK